MDDMQRSIETIPFSAASFLAKGEANTRPPLFSTACDGEGALSVCTVTEHHRACTQKRAILGVCEGLDVA
eukprot:762994-Hanusia_phi.AAC.4